MVDSSGPSLPIRCNTVGIQDLGDTEGWGDEGDGLYALELKEGIYHRARIPGTTPPIKWLLDFDLRNPYMHAGAKHVLRKWQNRGSALASLIPTRGRVELRGLPEVGYVLTAKKKNRSGEARLKLFSEYPYDEVSTVPDDCTIAFRIALGSPPKSPLILVNGLKINWGDDTAENEVVTIVVRTTKGKAKRILTTVASVRVTNTGDISLNELYLYTPGFALKKFLFTTSLPDISTIESYLNES